MNRVYVSGNLTRDPEVRYLDGGKAVTNFTIAVNERGRDGKEYTAFVRCAAWAELGVRIGETARVGTRLVIEGKLQQRTWTDAQGAKREELSVVAYTADIIVKPPPTQTTFQPDASELKDLPF